MSAEWYADGLRPCLLGLVSLWVWPLPDRPPQTAAGVDAGR